MFMQRFWKSRLIIGDFLHIDSIRILHTKYKISFSKFSFKFLLLTSPWPSVMLNQRTSIDSQFIGFLLIIPQKRLMDKVFYVEP